MSSTDITVSKLASVIVPVKDQDRELEVYTEVLGLVKRADVPFGPGRWIEVAPSGAETPIAICPPGPDAAAGGKETGISLQTDDIDAYHAQLKAEAWTWTPISVGSAKRCRRCSGSAIRREIA